MICLVCLTTVRADWKKVDSKTFAWFHSVYFVNQNKGWIVGSQGTFLETNDGGVNWKPKQKTSQDTIRDIYFADENHGWILCERNVYNSGSLSPSYILETFDGGENWRKVNLENEGKERLVKIFFSKDGFGRAVGEAGAFYAMQDDKTTWKKTTLPIPFLLLGGNFFSRSVGSVVGGGGTALFTEDGGITWNKANFTNKLNTKLNSVFFINRNIGWAVGAEGRIYTTLNGGKQWFEQNSNVKKDLFDVFFMNTANGWAVGDNGIILQTTTAGNIWTAVSTAGKHKLERLFFVGKTGWAVGFGGTILKYEPSPSDRNVLKPTPVLQKRNYSALH